MGFFSKQNSPTGGNETNIYVFVRSSNPSSQGSVTWSLAVSSKADTDVGGVPHSREKRISSRLFGHRHDSKPSTTEDPQPQTSNPTPTYNINEFTLSSTGDLKITNHHTREPLNSTSTDKDPNSSILLQILLPSSHQSPHQTQEDPTTQIEQILLHLTTPDSQPTETEPWLKSALLALQHEKILPSAPHFNVDKFMAFAHNSYAEFATSVRRGQVYTSTTISSEDHDHDHHLLNVDLRATHTKLVSYAAHVAENERLRAHFGHGPTTDGVVTQSFDEKSQHGFGGWWVSRPRDLRGRTDAWGRSDPYGGLM